MNLGFKKDVDAYHKIGRVDITEGMDNAGKKQEIQQLELIHASFFREQLSYHHQIDKTRHFLEFYQNIKPYTLSLPLIIYFKERILLILLSHLTRQNSQCLETLLDLIPSLVQDLSTEFIPHFGETIQVMISTLVFQNNEQIEKCFQSMQRIFKLLEASLTPYFLELYYSSFASLLSHGRELVREFAAETLGFLLNRIHKKQDLQTILSYLLLPPNVFIALMEDSLDNNIEIVKAVPGAVEEVQFTQNDHNDILHFQQIQQKQQEEARTAKLNTMTLGSGKRTFDLYSVMQNNQGFLSASDMSRLHDIKNIKNDKSNDNDKLFVAAPMKGISDGSLLSTALTTKMDGQKVTMTIAQKMRTISSMKDIVWSDVMIHRLTDGLSRLIFFSIKNVLNQLTFNHQRISDAFLLVTSSAYINQTCHDIIKSMMKKRGTNNNDILYSQVIEDLNGSNFNLHSFRLEITQILFSQLAKHTSYEQHHIVLDTLYKPLTSVILQLSNLINENVCSTGLITPTSSNTVHNLSDIQNIRQNPPKQMKVPTKVIKKRHVMADSSSDSSSSSSDHSDSDDEDGLIINSQNKRAMLLRKQKASKTTPTQAKISKKFPPQAMKGSDDDADADSEENGDKENNLDDENENVDSNKFSLLFNYTPKNAPYLQYPSLSDHYFDISSQLTSLQMLLTDSFGVKIVSYNNIGEVLINVLSVMTHTSMLSQKIAVINKDNMVPHDDEFNYLKLSQHDITALLYSILATNLVLLYKTIYRIHTTDAHTAIFTPTQHSTAHLAIQQLEKSLPLLLSSQKDPQRPKNDANIIHPIFYTILTAGLRLIVPNITFTTCYLPHIVSYTLHYLSVRQSTMENDNNQQFFVYNNDIVQTLDLAISPQPTYVTMESSLVHLIYTPLNTSSIFYQFIAGKSDPIATLSAHWASLWKNQKHTVSPQFKRTFYQQYILHRLAEYYHYDALFQSSVAMNEDPHAKRNEKEVKLLDKLNKNKQLEQSILVFEQQQQQVEMNSTHALKNALFTPYIYPLILHNNVITPTTQQLLKNLTNSLANIIINALSQLNQLFESQKTEGIISLNLFNIYYQQILVVLFNAINVHLGLFTTISHLSIDILVNGVQIKCKFMDVLYTLYTFLQNDLMLMVLQPKSVVNPLLSPKSRAFEDNPNIKPLFYQQSITILLQTINSLEMSLFAVGQLNLMDDGNDLKLILPLENRLPVLDQQLTKKGQKQKLAVIASKVSWIYQESIPIYPQSYVKLHRDILLHFNLISEDSITIKLPQKVTLSTLLIKSFLSILFLSSYTQLRYDLSCIPIIDTISSPLSKYIPSNTLLYIHTALISRLTFLTTLSASIGDLMALPAHAQKILFSRKEWDNTLTSTTLTNFAPVDQVNIPLNSLLSFITFSFTVPTSLSATTTQMDDTSKDYNDFMRLITIIKPPRIVIQDEDDVANDGMTTQSDSSEADRDFFKTRGSKTMRVAEKREAKQKDLIEKGLLKVGRDKEDLGKMFNSEKKRTNELRANLRLQEYNNKENIFTITVPSGLTASQERDYVHSRREQCLNDYQLRVQEQFEVVKAYLVKQHQIFVQRLAKRQPSDSITAQLSTLLTPLLSPKAKQSSIKYMIQAVYTPAQQCLYEIILPFTRSTSQIGRYHAIVSALTLPQLAYRDQDTASTKSRVDDMSISTSQRGMVMPTDESENGIDLNILNIATRREHCNILHLIYQYITTPIRIDTAQSLISHSVAILSMIQSNNIPDTYISIVVSIVIASFSMHFTGHTTQLQESLAQLLYNAPHITWDFVYNTLYDSLIHNNIALKVTAQPFHYGARHPYPLTIEESIISAIDKYTTSNDGHREQSLSPFDDEGEILSSLFPVPTISPEQAMKDISVIQQRNSAYLPSILSFIPSLDVVQHVSLSTNVLSALSKDAAKSVVMANISDVMNLFMLFYTTQWDIVYPSLQSSLVAINQIYIENKQLAESQQKQRQFTNLDHSLLSSDSLFFEKTEWGGLSRVLQSQFSTRSTQRLYHIKLNMNNSGIAALQDLDSPQTQFTSTLLRQNYISVLADTMESYLTIFLESCDKKVFYRMEMTQTLFIPLFSRLIGISLPKVQQLGFKLLVSADLNYITPYLSLLERLIDSKLYGNAVTTFIASLSYSIQQEKDGNEITLQQVESQAILENKKKTTKKENKKQKGVKDNNLADNGMVEASIDQRAPPGVLLIAKQHRPFLLPILFRLLNAQVRVGKKVHISSIRNQIAIVLSILPIYETLPYLSQHYSPLLMPMLSSISPAHHTLAINVLTAQFKQFNQMLQPLVPMSSQAVNVAAVCQKFSTTQQQYESLLSFVPHILIKTAQNDGIVDVLTYHNQSSTSSLDENILNVTMGNVLANTLLWSVDSKAQAGVMNIQGVVTHNDKILAETKKIVPHPMNQFVLATVAPTKILNALIKEIPALSKLAPFSSGGMNSFEYKSVIQPMNLTDMFLSPSIYADLPEIPVERLLNILHAMLSFIEKLRNGVSPLLSTLFNLAIFMLNTSTNKLQELQEAKVNKRAQSIFNNTLDETESDNNDDDENEDEERDEDDQSDSENIEKSPIEAKEDDKEETLVQNFTRLNIRIRQYKELRSVALQYVSLLVELFHEDIGLDVQIADKKDVSNKNNTLVSFFGKNVFQVVSNLQTISTPTNPSSLENELMVYIQPRKHFKYIDSLLSMLLPHLKLMYTEQFSRRSALINIIVSLLKHRSTQPILALPHFKEILPSFIGMLSSPFCDKNVSTAVIESIEHLINTRQQLNEEKAKIRRQTKKHIGDNHDDEDEDAEEFEIDGNESGGDMSDDEQYISRMNKKLNKALHHQRQLTSNSGTADTGAIALGLSTSLTPTDERSPNSPGLYDILSTTLKYLAPILCSHLNDRLCSILGVAADSITMSIPNDNVAVIPMALQEESDEKEQTTKKQIPTFEPTLFLNSGSHAKNLPTRELNLVFQISDLVSDPHTSSILTQLLLPHLPRGLPRPPYSLDVQGGISDMVALNSQDIQQGKKDKAVNYLKDKKSKVKTDEISTGCAVLTAKQLAQVRRENQIMKVILTIFTNILPSLTDIQFLSKVQEVFIAKLMTLFDLRLRVQLIDVLVSVKERIVSLTPKKKNKSSQETPVPTLSTHMLTLLSSLTAISADNSTVEPDFQVRSKAYQAIGTNNFEDFTTVLTEPIQYRAPAITSTWKCEFIKQEQFFSTLDLQALCWVMLHDLYSSQMTIRDYAIDAIIKLITNLSYTTQDFIMPTTQSRIVETFHRHARTALSRRELVVTRKSFLLIIATCGECFAPVFPSYQILNQLSCGSFFKMITDVQSGQRMVAFKAFRTLLESEFKDNFSVINDPTRVFTLQQPVYRSQHTSTVVQFVLPLLYNFVHESQTFFDLHHQTQDEDEESRASSDSKRKQPGIGRSGPFKNLYGVDNATIDEVIRCIATASRLLSWNQYKTHLIVLLNNLSEKNGKRLHKVNLRLVCAIIDLFPFPLGKSASEMTIEKNMNMFKEANDGGVTAETALQNPEKKQTGKNKKGKKDQDHVTLVQILNEQIAAPTSTHDAIRRDISTRLVPSILRFCTETTMKNGASNNKTTATQIRTVRTAVIMTVVRLLQHLAPRDFSLHFPKLIRIVVEQLGRKDPQERFMAREVLLEVFRSVGSDFLFYIIMELKQVLTKNYQVHVLSYDIVNLLGECSKLRLLYPAYCKKVEKGAELMFNHDQTRLQHQLTTSLYNPGRIAHNVDYCVPLIMQIMHDDFFGIIAEEKAILASASIHPEMKVTNSMLKTMNLLGRLITFNKMITMITCTLWTELDVIKSTTFKNNDPLLITHKLTLCCHNLVTGLKSNPTATFNDVVTFATTLLATSTGLKLDERFFNDSSFGSDGDFELLAHDSDFSDSDEDPYTMSDDDITVPGQEIKKKKAKKYTGEIYRNNQNFKSNVVNYNPDLHAGRKTTKDELYAIKDNRLLHKFQIDRHEVGELMKKVDITQLTLKNIDLNSYHSLSTIFLLCTDLFRLACTDGVMRSIEFDQNNNSHSDSDSDDSDVTHIMKDEIIQKQQRVEQMKKSVGSLQSQQYKRVLFLLDPLPQVLLRAILNIKRQDKLEHDQIGIISGGNVSINGGNDAAKRQQFQQQQARTGTVLLSALRLGIVLSRLHLHSWRRDKYKKVKLLATFTIRLLKTTPLPKYNPSTSADDRNKSLAKLGTRQHMDSVNASIHLTGTHLLRMIYQHYIGRFSVTQHNLQSLLDVLLLDVMHDGCGQDALHLCRIFIEKGRNQPFLKRLHENYQRSEALKAAHAAKESPKGDVQKNKKNEKMGKKLARQALIEEQQTNYHHPILIDIALKSADRMIHAAKPALRKQAMMLFYTYLNTFDISHSKMQEHVTWLLAHLDNNLITTRLIVVEVLLRIISGFQPDILGTHSQTLFLTLCVSLYNENHIRVRKLLSQCISTLFNRLKQISPDLLQPLLKMLFTWMSIDNINTLNPTHLRMSYAVLPLVLQPSIDYIAPFLPIIITSIAQIIDATNKRMLRESAERVEMIKKAYETLKSLKAKRQRKKLTINRPNIDLEQLKDDSFVLLTSAEYQTNPNQKGKNILPPPPLIEEDDEEDQQIDEQLRTYEQQIHTGDDDLIIPRQANKQVDSDVEEDGEVNDDDESPDDDFENVAQSVVKKSTISDDDVVNDDDAEMDEDNEDENDQHSLEQNNETEETQLGLNMSSQLACDEWYMCFSAMQCLEAVWKILPLPMMNFLNHYEFKTHKLLEDTSHTPQLHFWQVILSLTKYKHHWVRSATLSLINTHFELIDSLCQQAIDASDSTITTTLVPTLAQLFSIKSLHPETRHLLPLRNIPNMFIEFTVFNSIQSIFQTAQAICRLYNSAYLDEAFADQLTKAISANLKLLILFSDTKSISHATLQTKDILSIKPIHGEDEDLGSRSLVAAFMNQDAKIDNYSQYNHTALLWVSTNLSYLFRTTEDIILKQRILTFFYKIVQYTPSELLTFNSATARKVETQKVPTTEKGRTLLDSTTTTTTLFEPNPLLLSILSPVYRLIERQSKRTKDLKVQAMEVQSALSQKIGKNLAVDTFDYVRRSINNHRHNRRMGNIMKDKGNGLKKPRFNNKSARSDQTRGGYSGRGRSSKPNKK